MSNSIYNVLFLCTGNSARSILAQACLNHRGRGRFRAYSAGSHPPGQVNPLVLEILEKSGISVSGLRSKSWDEVAGSAAPALEFVFTVCDKAAGEVCPVWPGQPVTGHWGVADPSLVCGTRQQRMQTVQDTLRILERRIDLFMSLPISSLDRMSLRKRLQEIGKS